MAIHSVAKRKRPRPADRQPLNLALGIAAAMLLMSGVALALHAHVARKSVNPEEARRALAQDRTARRRALERWEFQEPRLAHALKQERLELGAVWTTRGGRVCGLVNGWGSFGGLTGMTRFYTEGDRFVFSARTREGFHPIWRACQADRWQVLHAGTEERGFCGTRLGQKRCLTEEGWTRYPPTPY